MMIQSYYIRININGCADTIAKLSEANPDFTSPLSELKGYHDPGDLIFEFQFAGGRLDFAQRGDSIDVLCQGYRIGWIDGEEAQRVLELIGSDGYKGAWLEYGTGRCLELYEDDDEKIQIRRSKEADTPVIRIECEGQLQKQVEKKVAPKLTPKAMSKGSATATLILSIIIIFLGLILTLSVSPACILFVVLGVILLIWAIKSKPKK